VIQSTRAKPCRLLAAASLAVTTAVIGACAGDSDASGAGGSGPSSAGTGGLATGGIAAIDLPYAPCPEGEAVGQFVIGLDVDEGYTYVEGKVSDGTSPSSDPVELGRAGDCRLLRAVPNACASTCPATEVCGREGECVAEPRNRDLGTVTVHGLLIPMQMSPNAVTHRYSNPAQPLLPHPGFVPGADLRIRTAGGDYAPFELRGWGVSPLVLGSEPIEVAAGQATRLSWQAPAVPGPTRLDVQLDINLHGSTKAKIECSFADSGAAEIPATLIDGLIAEGFSGFPTLTALRRNATSLAIEPGCVELIVVAQITTSIQVEGVISCNDEMPCPSGQTCLQVELFCQ
jgi:hypothetical protein